MQNNQREDSDRVRQQEIQSSRVSFRAAIINVLTISRRPKWGDGTLTRRDIALDSQPSL
jgi:hypothetical protein